MELDSRVVRFIRKHHVLTLATATIDQRGVAEPYCSNMFYVYVADRNMFVFSSDSATRHIKDVEANEFVAGSIVLESRIVGNLQGLQFQGRMRSVDRETEGDLRKAYLLKYPFSAAMELTLWVIEPTFMKLTDNKLGFGKKIIWTLDE